MVLVDTSAWIEFLRATGSEADGRLTEIVAGGTYAITDVVAAELSMGAPAQADPRLLRRIVDSARFYPIRPLFDYETAAEIYRVCRLEGSTPRSLTDCLVAAVAINNDLAVLAADRDFDRMAAHVSLRLV
jgi:predicted nucleic acid-binding protein